MTGRGVIALAFAFTAGNAAGCSRGSAGGSPAAGGASAAAQEDTSAGPPAAAAPIAGAVRFCSEHVAGPLRDDGRPSEHLLWRALHSEVPVAQVVEHYAKRLGAAGERAADGTVTWRLPGRHGWLLRVAPAAANGPWRICQPPPPAARSVIAVSSVPQAK